VVGPNLVPVPGVVIPTPASVSEPGGICCAGPPQFLSFRRRRAPASQEESAVPARPDPCHSDASERQRTRRNLLCWAYRRVCRNTRLLRNGGQALRLPYPKSGAFHTSLVTSSLFFHSSHPRSSPRPAVRKTKSARPKCFSYWILISNVFARRILQTGHRLGGVFSRLGYRGVGQRQWKATAGSRSTPRCARSLRAGSHPRFARVRNDISLT
jgi:hypothetical protein